MHTATLVPAAYDVVVVGGGPAGAAAAFEAVRRRPASRVLVLDKARFPRDKPCGDGIAPHAMDELAALGIADEVLAGYPPIERLRLRTPEGLEAGGRMRRPTRVIPRSVFDARLLAAACAAGAELRQEKVRTVEHHGGCVVVNERYRARVLIAADGANSTVRRLVGLAPNPARHLAVAVRGYAPAAAAPPEQLIQMLADGWPAYAWSFPVGDGTTNVGYGLLRANFDGSKRELHERLAAALPDLVADRATLRAHHLPLSSSRPSPGRGRVLLAGDAASFINPLTGEGIYYALASGRLAAGAAVEHPEDAARRYRQSLGTELGRHFRHTGVVARLIRHQPIVAAAVHAAGRSPTVFHALVELGLGRGLFTPPLLAAIARAYPQVQRAAWRAGLAEPAVEQPGAAAPLP